MTTMQPDLYRGPQLPATMSPEVTLDQRLRRARIAMAVLVFGLGGAAAFVPIGGAVVASGQIGVESHVKRVAHPVGGTIAEIYVQNGDHVDRGTPLLRLDDTVSGNDAELSALSVDQLMAQKARLEAEQLGAATITFPPALANRTDAAAVKAMENERKMFAIRQGEQGGLRAQLSARIAQYQQQIAGFQSQIAASRQQMALIRPEREGIQSLYEKGLVTLNRKNQLDRQEVDYQGSVASLQTQIAQTQARITEAREQLIQLGQTRRSDAGTQLASVNAALNQQQQRSVQAGDLQNRSLIRAPHAGIVDKLAFATIGDVVKPGEPILEIVPDGDRKVIEVLVAPSDIDQIAVGQPARIRLSAYSTAATPEVTGKVIQVAADRSVDPESKRAFYAARVSIDPADMKRISDLKLIPGMPAEVFIATGSRSMLSYVTKPLRDQFARAFRDES